MHGCTLEKSSVNRNEALRRTLLPEKVTGREWSLKLIFLRNGILGSRERSSRLFEDLGSSLLGVTNAWRFQDRA